MRALLTKSLIASLALLVAVGAFTGAAWAKTIFVNAATGNNATCAASPFITPCQTINKALTTPGLLAPGDTVVIFPGFYPEAAASAVTVPNVTIVGSGPSTIIDGTGIANAAATGILEINANNVTLANFRIQNSQAGAGLPCANSPAGNAAILVGNTTTPVTTSGVIITGVEATLNILGIVICNSNQAKILQSNIHDNGAGNFGVALDEASYVLVQSNRFFNFPAGVANTGLILRGTAAIPSQNNTISNNTFAQFNTDAINVGSAGTSVNNNTFDRNIFTIVAAANGINFATGTPNGNSVTNSTFQGNLTAGENGITFGVAATATSIQGNQLRNLANGINFAAAATTSVVTNNLFTGNTNGIAFGAAIAVANNLFTRNVITQNTIGVLVGTAAAGAVNNVFTQNNIEGNLTNGWSFTAAAVAGAFLANSNWWGDASGPTCVAAACTTVGGLGNSVIGAPAIALATEPRSTVPFATVFGTSLERAPAPLAVSSIQAVGLGGFRPGLQVRVQGQGIAGVQLQVYDLSGRLVTDQSASGASLRWNGLSSQGQTLANGVYLYVVTVKGYDGKVIRSEVRKLVILR